MNIKFNDVCKFRGTYQDDIFHYLKYEKLAAANRNRGLWNVTPCGLAGSEQRFGGIYWLHLQGRSHILKTV
jgi:hypothetical protein